MHKNIILQITAFTKINSLYKPHQFGKTQGTFAKRSASFVFYKGGAF